MRRLKQIALLLAGVFFPVIAFASNINTLNIIPQVRQWHSEDQQLYLSQDTNYPLPHIVYTQVALAQNAHYLARAIRSLTHRKISVQSASRCQADSICLSLDTDWYKAWASKYNHVAQKRIKEQGYQLTLGSSNKGGAQIQLTSATTNGIFYGMQSLLQLIAQSPKKLSYPAGKIIDWPYSTERSVMLDVARKYFPPSYLKQLINLMAYYKMNLLHLHLSDWNAFRLNSPVFPGLAPKKANYNKSQIINLIQYAAKRHIAIMPEIDIPGHTTVLNDYYQNTYAPQAASDSPKSIAFSCPSMASYKIGTQTHKNWTMDVTKPETLKFVKRLVQTFKPWFDSKNDGYPLQGKYFHLGADEYPNTEIMSQCAPLVAKCYDRHHQLLKACKGPMTDKGISTVEPGGLFVLFLNQLNRDLFNQPDSHTQMRIWTGWNAASPAIASTAKYSSSPINPDNSIAIDSWLVTNNPHDLIDQGFDVTNTSFQITYLTPGFANQSGDYPPPEPYLLNKWSPNVFIKEDLDPKVPVKPKIPVDHNAPNLLGAGLQVWADSATTKPVMYFDTLLQRPLKLIANATWNGGHSVLTLKQFVKNAAKIGPPPGTKPRKLQQHWFFSKDKYNLHTLNKPTLIGKEDLSVPWSFATWIKVTSAPNHQKTVLLQSSLNPSSPGVYSLNLSNINNKIGYTNGVSNTAGTSSPVGTFSFKKTITPGPWIYLTYVGTRSGVSLYVNGRRLGSNLSVMSLPLEFLGSSDNTIDGYLASPFMTNVALSPAAVRHCLMPLTDPRHSKQIIPVNNIYHCLKKYAY